ncbi:calpain-13 isoform X2 [Cervus canadensis]|uniref:calpain-13 isoform X2 n=1 Tax=Cervus canadensis TaxID=1574408 RepID=UPI001C9E4FD0|nr:calpain-13 isoform X2 [Cervus canadensis]
MAHNQQFPAKTPIIKFKEQDFYSLRDHCLNRGLLFEDETFPAETYSIGLQLLKGKDLSNLSWMRPKDLLKGKSEPLFILEGASRFDIQQGEAGDCWFLAALGSLTQSPQYLQKILIDQSFSYQYAGIFRFRFWRCGQWVEVVIDDRLPVLNNEYLFVKPRNKREFWPCLLEKAYAKFHGSYANLHYGYLPDALVDLTGGVVTNISLHLSSSDLMTMVKMAAEAGSLMTCGTLAGPTSESMRMANGLVSLHAYTVTGAEQIEYRRRWEYLIRLWNPWGKIEWSGRWSDRMSCQDFRDNFFGLFICNQVPISLDHGSTLHERWSQMMFKDHLIPGNTEGYQRDMQYIFSVPDSVENNNVIMSFNIGPQNLKEKDKTFPLKYKVFKVDYQFQHFQERLPSTFFSKFRIAEKGIVSETTCNLTECFSLSPGTYVVVVSEGREAIEFLLRIFLKMPDSDRHLDGSLNLRALQASLPGNGSQKSIFYKYAQQGLDIDATQLQSLLNREFLSGPPGDAFSLDECRSIVALMDLKVNGRLDQEEFSRLWSRLVHCQSVFQNSPKNADGFLSSDLWKAIKDTDFLAGISITSELLDLMKLRYSDSTGRVSFPSLVCLLMRLEAMAKAFQNLSKDGKGLYLTEMEWMNLVMYN